MPVFGALGNPSTLDHTYFERLRSNSQDQEKASRVKLYSFRGRAAYLGSTSENQPYGDIDCGVVVDAKADTDTSSAQGVTAARDLTEFKDLFSEIKFPCAVVLFRHGVLYMATYGRPLHYWKSRAGDFYFSNQAKHLAPPAEEITLAVPANSVLELPTGQLLKRKLP